MGTAPRSGAGRREHASVMRDAVFFFFSSRRRHTRLQGDWSSDVCSSDLRMSMMHAGKVLDSDTPARLVAKRGAATLEEAFIGYLVEAGGGEAPAEEQQAAPAAPAAVETHTARHRHFSAQRMLSYVWREALELQRDPVRATLALVGSRSEERRVGKECRSRWSPY